MNRKLLPVIAAMEKEDHVAIMYCLTAQLVLWLGLLLWEGTSIDTLKHSTFQNYFSQQTVY